jgi:hypothetical protein
MDSPIQDGIRDGGVWKSGMPFCHRYLRGKDLSSLSKAVIVHFQQILRYRKSPYCPGTFLGQGGQFKNKEKIITTLIDKG